MLEGKGWFRMKKGRILAMILAVTVMLGAVPAGYAEASGTDRSTSAVAGGSSHSVAVTAKGEVYTWGSNRSGQLGIPGLDSTKKPEKVEGVTAVAVAAGYDFTAALSYSGSVYSWGMGQGNAPAHTDLTSVMKIDAGQTDILALRADGTVWQWTYGGTPRQVAGLSQIVDISCGGGHYLALTVDGNVYAWGGNYYGQLGDGTTTDRATPVKLGLVNIVDIAAGFSHSLAASYDGRVYAWGSNEYGQLGDGTTDSSKKPVETQKLKNITRVAAGNGISMALNAKGSVSTWGYGEFGQLGNGSSTIAATAPVSAGVSGKVVEIACGVQHCMAVTESGALYTWGRNRDGQLGDNKDNNGQTAQRVRDDIYVGGSYRPDATASASSWAVTEISGLYNKDLVPPMLWGKYTTNITRAEFASMLVGLYENVKNTTASESTAQKYIDIDGHPLEKDLRKALSVGLISGSSGNTVSPDRTLTRQEGAKMLCSFISKVKGVTISQKPKSLAFYRDATLIHDWAAPYVYYAYENNLMTGNAQGEFSPLADLTREQSLVIVSRIVEKYGWGKK